MPTQIAELEATKDTTFITSKGDSWAECDAQNVEYEGKHPLALLSHACTNQRLLLRLSFSLTVSSNEKCRSSSDKLRGIKPSS